jgi:hypothetical protein
MRKIFRNGLLMFVAGTFAVSCADYNETYNFKADPDPQYVEPYNDLKAVKSYIDRETYPNLTLGATLKVSEFNKQDLAHAAAVTNFDNVAFGTSLMSGTIVNAKGVMNFLDMIDLLAHVEEIGYEVYGSPIFANANQADDWLKTLTAPIEIPVEYVEGKSVDFNEMPVGSYDAALIEKGKAAIVKYDNQNALEIGLTSNVRILAGFDVDPLAKYTATFYARSDKDATFDVNFSGNKITGTGPNGKWTFKKDKWTKIVVEAQSAEGVTEGFLRIDNALAGKIYIQKAQIGYYPDNHRPQTEQELKDTIRYAINAWCDGLMKINEGRIESFDLIDEPINAKAVLDNGMYDLKHASDKIYWQDVLGSENYAPVVSNVASSAFAKYDGELSDLKFFISESGLDDQKKFESLMYWIGIWDNNGAKIDGINAKLNLVYSEDAATQEANKAALDKLLDNLASSGKLVRLSNFDIKYQDASGQSVAAEKITDEQRQKLANYYGDIIKSYMAKIDKTKQAGLCKGNMADTSDPVGLWSVDSKTKDWVRTATYKAFCDAFDSK